MPAGKQTKQIGTDPHAGVDALFVRHHAYPPLMPQTPGIRPMSLQNSTLDCYIPAKADVLICWYANTLICSCIAVLHHRQMSRKEKEKAKSKAILEFDERRNKRLGHPSS